MDDLETNLRSVADRLAAAARRVGRDPAEITLVAVSKYQPPAVIRAAYELGLRHFGENRIDEALAKAADLPDDITWHMIGHVQSRQAKRLLPLFSLVHSVDSVKLARRLEGLCAEQDRRLSVLLEFNVSGETSKYGFVADRWPVDAGQRRAVLDSIEEMAGLPHLDIRGLMTMAPIVAEAEEARPWLARLRELRDDLAATFPAIHWSELSMGMTDDFEVAIEEGATLVRVGRAIFAPELGAWCELPIQNRTQGATIP
jgi:hypothetical protein